MTDMTPKYNFFEDNTDYNECFCKKKRRKQQQLYIGLFNQQQSVFDKVKNSESYKPF